MAVPLIVLLSVGAANLVQAANVPGGPLITVHHWPTGLPNAGYDLITAPVGWTCSVNGGSSFVVPMVQPMNMAITGPNPSVGCTPPSVAICT